MLQIFFFLQVKCDIKWLFLKTERKLKLFVEIQYKSFFFFFWEVEVSSLLEPGTPGTEPREHTVAWHRLKSLLKFQWPLALVLCDKHRFGSAVCHLRYAKTQLKLQSVSEGCRFSSWDHKSSVINAALVWRVGWEAHQTQCTLRRFFFFLFVQPARNSVDFNVWIPEGNTCISKIWSWN